jgi:negative regulator of sigma E activity
MSLSHHQQRQLHRIETGLLQADPQLAEMLGIFGKLSASQAMPSWEQVPTRRDRVRQAAALTVQAVTLAAAAVGLLLRRSSPCSSSSPARVAATACPHPGSSAPAAAGEPAAARTRPVRADR